MLKPMQRPRMPPELATNQITCWPEVKKQFLIKTLFIVSDRNLLVSSDLSHHWILDVYVHLEEKEKILKIFSSKKKNLLMITYEGEVVFRVAINLLHQVWV